MEDEISIYRVPGRTELGGNHTDHQGGSVLAAAIDRWVTAKAKKTGDDRITVRSEGFGECSFDLSETGAEFAKPGTVDALVRGVCDSFLESGNSFGGFEAEITSEVPAGKGLASS
ncbi:MAG TPA: galactokinase family protein, partial [Oscillospiraceae bacterium]|nr:galactokinase family protein [Oscillospiraceae bacterium]